MIPLPNLKEKIAQQPRLRISLVHTLVTYRRLTAIKERVLPDFLIIGAQKCGTTSLYSYLTQHPGVIAALAKEVHYFENPRNRAQGEAWYRAHFCTTAQRNNMTKRLGYRPLTGEATPNMIDPLVPRLVHDLVPHAKLIVLVRNPIVRAFSHYQHNVRKGDREPLTFAEAIHAESQRLTDEATYTDIARIEYGKRLRTYSYLARGFYYEQLERWLHYFPLSHLHVIKSEDFFEQPQSTLDKVLEFLEIPSHQFNIAYASNVGNYQNTVPQEFRAQLAAFFQPENERLYNLLGQDFGWD